MKVVWSNEGVLLEGVEVGVVEHLILGMSADCYNAS